MQNPIRQGEKKQTNRRPQIEASQVEKEIRHIPARSTEFHSPKSDDEKWKEFIIEIGAQRAREAAFMKFSPPERLWLGLPMAARPLA